MFKGSGAVPCRRKRRREIIENESRIREEDDGGRRMRKRLSRRDQPQREGFRSRGTPSSQAVVAEPRRPFWSARDSCGESAMLRLGAKDLPPITALIVSRPSTACVIQHL
jgi:hypothetical protein